MNDDRTATGTARRALSLFFALLPSWVVIALPVKFLTILFTSRLVGRIDPFDSHAMAELGVGFLFGPLMIANAVSLLAWAAMAVPLIGATHAAESGTPSGVMPFFPPQASRVFRVAWSAAAVWLVAGCGALLLLIPGIYWGLRLALTPAAGALSSAPRSPLSESWSLARGHMLHILGTLALVTVPLACIALPFWLIEAATENAIVDAFSAAVTGCVAEGATVALTLLYLRLSPATAASEFTSPSPVSHERSTGIFE